MMKPRGKPVISKMPLPGAVTWFALSLTVAGMTAAHAQTGSVPQGKQLFESRCIGCHSLDTHRVGPALGSVFGRVAGKAVGFDYSAALKGATHVWDAPGLKSWLTNPEALVPGQGMGYRVDLSADRNDLVAYLASLSPQPALN